MKTKSIILITVALAIVLGIGSHVLAQAVGSQDQQSATQQNQRMSQERNVVQGAQLHISPSAVQAVKEQLQQMGHNPGQISGEWNNQVQQALIQFQQAQGLEPTGNLNLDTIQAMDFSQILRGQESADQAQQGGQAARGEGAPLFISPASVRNIQQSLQQAGHDPGQVDGKWGPATQNALKEYQQAKGLEPTGLVSLRVLADMGMDQELAALQGEEGGQTAQRGEEGQQQRGYVGQSRPEGDTAQAERPAQQNGGWGAPLFISMDGVREIQQSLKEAGHDPGSIDGLWGPSTANAAREFQNEKGLAPTGNLNISTIHALVGNLDFELAAQSGQREPAQQRQAPEQGRMQQPGSQQPGSPGMMQSDQPPGQSPDQPMGQGMDQPPSGQQQSSGQMDQPSDSDRAAEPQSPGQTGSSGQQSQ
jgi:peptidoglycan hydrolase-like protein with peptidoglycan-binding domain